MAEQFSLNAGDGTITVAPRGARVLGCRVEGLDGNLFYEDESGNGGDRLWIAPEVAYFWPSLEDARRDPVGTAITPAEVDPGDYSVSRRWDNGVELKGDATLTDSRSGKTLVIDITRTVSAISPPELPEGLSAGVKCASFTLVNELHVADGDEGAVGAAWDILQVPPTGTLICPTTRKVAPRSYYDPFGDRHVVSDDRCVRFLIDGKHRIKMGLRPEDTTGRMGYYRQHTPGSGPGNGMSSLIVRVFPAFPGEQYVEIPRDHPAQQLSGGDALQAYNDDQTYGDFGEMEFVAPAVVVGGCEYRSTASVTHVLVGDDAAIREAGGALLGVEVNAIE